MDNTSERSSRKASSAAVTKIAISAMMLALAVAFAAIAKYIPFLHFPQGGSIAISMVPLALVSYYCGGIWGMVIGMAFGVIDMLMDGYYGYTWVTIFLDYIVAFGFAGVCGFFRKKFFQKKISSLMIGMILFGILRFLSSFLSGCIVWNAINGEADYTGFASMPKPDFSSGSVIYSMTYNGGYMIPSIVLCCILLVVLAKPIFTTLGFTRIRPLRPEVGEENSQDILSQTNALIPYYLLLIFVFAVLGMIPALSLSNVGYVTLIADLILIGYLVYVLVKKKEGLEMKWIISYLSVAAIVLGLSLCAIVSPYTYALSYYSAE